MHGLVSCVCMYRLPAGGMLVYVRVQACVCVCVCLLMRQGWESPHPPRLWNVCCLLGS